MAVIANKLETMTLSLVRQLHLESQIQVACVALEKAKWSGKAGNCSSNWRE